MSGERQRERERERERLVPSDENWQGEAVTLFVVKVRTYAATQAINHSTFVNVQLTRQSHG